MRGARVTGRTDAVLAVLDVDRDVDGGGEPVAPALADEVAVRAGKKILRARLPQQPCEGAGEQQRTHPGRRAVPGDVGEGEVQVVVASGGDDEVTAECIPA